MARTLKTLDLAPLAETIRAIPGVSSVTHLHAPGSALERLLVSYEGDATMRSRITALSGASLGTLAHGARWASQESQARHLNANTPGRVDAAVIAALRTATVR